MAQPDPSTPAGPDPRFGVAASHATLRVPVAAPDDDVAAVRRAMAGASFDCASHVAVCVGGRFIGLVRIEDLCRAAPGTTIAAVMDRDPPTVQPGVDQERAAWSAVERGESALCVVDRDGRFAGLIPPHRLLGVLLAEHEEDMARLGGFLRGSANARLASEAPPAGRFLRRLPWLLLGLGGALFAADLVGWFETRLEEKLLLAFFLPGVVYLADAVGTQTETVVVRGLSLGVPLRRTAAQELVTGLALGVALGALAMPLVWLRWGDFDVALAVGLAMAATCAIATLVAMTLPYLLDRSGLDPAYGSGPLATVIQDLLSIMVYFAIAAAILD